MMMNLPCLMASCANFLRPIYHTLSADQVPKRGHAPRIKPMPATALVFLFDCYRPAFNCHGTDLLSGRYTITAFCWSCGMQSISDSIIYGFLFQNPVQPPIPSISCSTEFWIMLLDLCFLCCQ